MARITGTGVVSVKDASPVEPAPEVEEEVPSSPGNSSSTSSESTTTNDETPKQPRRSRARMAVSRSKKTGTES